MSSTGENTSGAPGAAGAPSAVGTTSTTGAPARPSRLRLGVKTIGFMFVVTLVFIAALSVVYLLTRDTIRANETRFLKRAVLAAAGVPLGEDPTQVDRIFEERVREKTAPSGTVYYEILAEGGSEPAGYVLISTGPGLWGKIVATVGIGADLQTLTGLEFIEQQETPGLGARISEPWFISQFAGKRGPFRTVPEGEQAGEQEFQAVTGATITSNAVLRIVNGSLADAPQVIENGK